VQLEHATAVEHRLPLGASKDEPRATARRPAAWADAPAAGHAQVVPQQVTALEAQDEVLPERLDGYEPPAVEASGVDRGLGTRVRRLHLDAFADEYLQAPSRPVQRVALGH